MIQFDVHIFQRGWFNHQLEKIREAEKKSEYLLPDTFQSYLLRLGAKDGIFRGVQENTSNKQGVRFGSLGLEDSQRKEPPKSPN